MAGRTMLWDDACISAMIDGFDYLSDYEEEEEEKESDKELRIQRCIEEEEREEREEKEAEERIRVLQEQIKNAELKVKDEIKN